MPLVAIQRWKAERTGEGANRCSCLNMAVVAIQRWKAELETARPIASLLVSLLSRLKAPLPGLAELEERDRLSEASSH